VALILSTFVAKFDSSENLHWDIKQVGNSEVDVYLKGPSVNKVIGADIDLFFDKNNLKITSVDPGGFFSDPIVIRLDNRNLFYSLMVNPESKIGPDSSKPLFKFHLLPNEVSGYKFYVLPSSQVYLSKIGGSFPKASWQNLK
jgi:hypothetical protein